MLADNSPISYFYIIVINNKSIFDMNIFKTTLLSLSAAAAAGCSPKLPPVETFAEADDPTPVTAEAQAAWDAARKGLHGAWGSPDLLYPRSEIPAVSADKTFRATAWRGERVSAQIVLWTADGADGVTCEVGDLRSGRNIISSDAVSARFVRYTLADRSDPICLCNRKADHPTVLVPDMLDTLSHFDMAPRTVRPVWITVNVPYLAAAGTYRTEAVIRHNGRGRIRLPIEIEVQDHILPEPRDRRYHLDLWQHPSAVARAEGLEMWSDAHFEALERQMKILAQAGQKVITATLNKDPWNHQCYDAYEDMIVWTKHADGSWSYDYTVFDRWVGMMLELGIDKMINCYSMLPWNNELVYFDEAAGESVTVRPQPGTPEFAAMWEPFLRDFKKHLQDKAWLGITNIAMDERSPEAMDEAVKLIGRAAPELGFALADNHYSYKRYTKMRDICIAQRQPIDHADIEARRAAGQVTTYYVCCSTHYPNAFTFSQPFESELLGWYALAWDFDGMLRWAFNSWPADPQYDSRFARLPSGDTYMVYPFARSSMRFERLIDGIEEAEKARIRLAELTSSGKTERYEPVRKVLERIRTTNINDPSQPWREIVAEANEAVDRVSEKLN